jgi:hypothetical protein
VKRNPSTKDWPDPGLFGGTLIFSAVAWAVILLVRFVFQLH